MDESPSKIQVKADVNYGNTCPCGAMLIAASTQNGAKRYNLGFSLVELVVVMAILAILASIAISGIAKYRSMARNNRAMSEIRTIASAVSGFYADRGFRPPDLNAVNFDTLRDPWGQPYRYAAPGTRLFTGNPVNLDYDIWSSGEDGATDPSFVDSDDIIRTLDGGRVGMAYKYGTPEY